MRTNNNVGENKLKNDSSKKNYRVIVFHKDHPFSPNGIHSGAEMGTIHIGRALARNGYEITIIGKITSGSGIYDNVEYIDIGPAYDYTACLNTLKNRKFDLLISVTRADVIKASMKFDNIDKRALWLQDSALEETRGTFEEINNSADLIIYVSNVLREYLESFGIDKELGVIIYNGFDNSIFHPRSKGYDKNKIIYAGAIVPEKGINLLLDAFNILSLKNKDLELWLYGSESLWGYKDFFDKKRITYNNPKIHFAGKVTQQQLAEAFSGSAIAIIPSLASKRLDPFPLISIEAQASGCPVVVTKCGGLPEGVIDGQTGFILNSEEPEELASVLEKYFSQKELQDQFRINARTHVEKNYDWDVIAENFVEAAQNAVKAERISSHSTDKPKNDKQKILFITQQIPCYDRTGGDFRTFRILRQIALEGHSVDLIARDTVPDYYIEMTDEEREKYLETYSELNIKIDFLEQIVVDDKSNVHRIKINNINQLLSSRKYDAVVIVWWNIALSFTPIIRRLLPNARLIIDSVDIAFLRMLRYAALYDLKELWVDANQIKQRELEAYQNADAVLAVTDDDKDVLLNELPNICTHVVTNVHPVSSKNKKYNERKDLLFVGYFKHKPNEDAAKYLVNDIFPLIKKEIPDIKLYLVGNAPPKEILELSSDSIIVTGFVEDLTPYWQNCRLSVAPLRYGAGFKGKVGQSMAEGLPVVTTNIGIEGMELVVGEEVFIADNPREFCEQVVKAYKNEALWNKLSENGLKKVKENWSDEIVAKRLIEACVIDKSEFDFSIKNENVINETNYYSLVSKGYFWLNFGLNKSAESIFISAINNYPKFSNAYLALANLYYSSERYEDSLNCLLECAERESLTPGYHTLLGLLNNKFTNYDDACENFKLALKTYYNNSLAHYELGNYYYYRKLYSQSLYHYHSAVKSGCKDFIMLNNVSLMFLKYGNIAEAVKMLLTAISLTNSNNDFYHSNIFTKKLINIQKIKNIWLSTACSKHEKIDISIIIPTFNKVDFTKRCINALERTNSKISYEIIIVDNSSTDSSSAFLEKHIRNKKHKIKAVLLSKNLGFSKANNIGADIAQGDYLVFLNNDTEVLTGWLDALFSTAENDLSIGAVGSKLLYPDRTIQHAGVIITKNEIINDPLLPQHVYYKEKEDLPAANISKEYQALTAACLLVRRNVFDAAGGFDENFWNGYEDVDLCFKIRELGWKLVYQPKSIVIHYESQSGAERFTKVKDNIKLLHQKWIGKVKPDFFITSKGKVLETDADIICEYGPAATLNNIKNNSYDISIVTLTYNQLDYTKQFINSIKEFVKLSYELIIVDNASTDGTTEYLQTLASQNSNIKLILNDNNLGFPTAVNQGIKEATGKYIVITNNDIVLTANSMMKMIQAAESDSQIGLVGPISNEVSGLQKDENAKYDSIEEMHKYADEVAEKNNGELLYFPRIAFLYTLIKKEVIEKIGGLDERFSPGNYEDDDFCLRAQLAGYKTVIAKDVFIHHYGSKSFKANGEKAYQERLDINKKIFVDKWGATPDEIWLQNKSVNPRQTFYPINKDLFTQFFERTNVHLADKELDLAEESIAKAIEHFESGNGKIDRTELLNLAGNISLATGNLEKAQEYFAKELDLTPSSSSACLGLGNVFISSEQFENAKTMLEWAVKNDQSNQLAKDRLSEVNQLLGFAEDHNTLFEDVDDSANTEEIIQKIVDCFVNDKFSEAINIIESNEKIITQYLENLSANDYAEFYNMKGFIYLSSEKDIARTCFENALNANPTSSQACVGLGEVFFIDNMIPEAKTMYEWGAVYDSQNQVAIDGLARLNELLGYDLMHNTLLENIDFEDIFNKAAGLYKESKFQEAIDLIEQNENGLSLLINNGITGVEFSTLLNLKGFCYLGLNDEENAELAFGKSINTNPESSQACAGIGVVFLSQGRTQDAKTMLEWALKNDSSNAIAKASLAKANEILGYPENHNSLFDGVSFETVFVQAYNYFINSDFSSIINLFDQHEEELAKSIYNGTSKEDYASLLNLKGYAYLSLDEIDNARKSFELALKTNPESSQACTGLGEVFLYNNQIEEAKTMFEWGVKNAPQNKFAIDALANVNKLLGLNEYHSSLTEV